MMVYDGQMMVYDYIHHRLLIYTTYFIYMVINWGMVYDCFYPHYTVFFEEKICPNIFAPGHRLSEVHRRSALMLGRRRWSAAVFLLVSSITMVYGRYNELVNGDYNGLWY